jgi:hypothetical protein
MVETALVDAGALADIINANGAITAIPDQVEGDLEQFFFGFTGLFHFLRRVVLLRQSENRIS